MKFALQVFAIAVLVIAIILGIMMYAGVSAAYRRGDSINNFRSIAMSISTYVDFYKKLPQPVYFDKKSGEPLYSWRYRIIPYVGSYKRDLFYDFKWDHKVNAIWWDVPQPFANNGFKEGVWQGASPRIPNKTNIFAITGPDTGFGEPKLDKPVDFDKLPKDLVLFAEVAQSGKHWMEPGDFDIRTMDRRINGSKSNSISSVHKDGFFVMFSDLEIWYLSNRIPFKVLAEFFTITGARKNDRSHLLEPYRLY